MKNILKYLTPLLIGGVIIPLCTYYWVLKPQPPIIPQVKSEVISPANLDGTFHLYIINDAVAKLLPVFKFI